MRQPVTPQALQPNPIHMLACVLCAKIDIETGLVVWFCRENSNSTGQVTKSTFLNKLNKRYRGVNQNTAEYSINAVAAVFSVCGRRSELSIHFRCAAPVFLPFAPDAGAGLTGNGNLTSVEQKQAVFSRQRTYRRLTTEETLHCTNCSCASRAATSVLKELRIVGVWITLPSASV